MAAKKLSTSEEVPSTGVQRNSSETEVPNDGPFFISLDEAQLAEIADGVPGGAENIQEVYPLTPSQEGMLFHHLLNRQSDTYVISTLLEIESRERAQ